MAFSVAVVQITPLDIGVSVMFGFFGVGLTFMFISDVMMGIVGWVKDMLG
jgi:hypothetical protein